MVERIGYMTLGQYYQYFQMYFHRLNFTLNVILDTQEVELLVHQYRMLTIQWICLVTILLIVNFWLNLRKAHIKGMDQGTHISKILFWQLSMTWFKGNKAQGNDMVIFWLHFKTFDLSRHLLDNPKYHCSWPSEIYILHDLDNLCE